MSPEKPCWNFGGFPETELGEFLLRLNHSNPQEREKKRSGLFNFDKTKPRHIAKLFSESPENDFSDPVIGQKLACEESKCDLKLSFLISTSQF